MLLFYRTTLDSADVLAAADAFFPAAPLSLSPAKDGGGPRERTFSGVLGTAKLKVRSEGGHYTFVEVKTDQIGESRLDKNVKKFFVSLHRQTEPTHALEASY
ncbi:MAG TPA: hypothetical protein VFA43_15710 [Gemmatimonadaceae bacterium]|nr:hypothetical protein [Gemmatimonadaceae bacterium]